MGLLDNLTLPGLVSSLGGLIGGGTDVANIGIQERNYQQQKDLLQYQKDTQQKSWQREDTAVQRRVSDLRAAGLSPTLAAGSSAASSSPISLSAPQRDTVKTNTGFDDAAVAMSLMTAKANIAQTIEQTKLLQLQQAKTATETISNQQNNWRQNHDNLILEGSGILSTANYGRDFASIGNILNKALGSASPVLQGAMSGLGNIFNKVLHQKRR